MQKLKYTNHHFGTSKNSISTFFEKKIIFLGFHSVVIVKTFPLMYQLLGTVGPILTKLGCTWFLVSGYGQTDRHDFGILIWKHVDTQKKNSTQSSKLRAVDRYMHPRMTGMDKTGWRGCIKIHYDYRDPSFGDFL